MITRWLKPYKDVNGNRPRRNDAWLESAKIDHTAIQPIFVELDHTVIQPIVLKQITQQLSQVLTYILHSNSAKKFNCIAQFSQML